MLCQATDTGTSAPLKQGPAPCVNMHDETAHHKLFQMQQKIIL